MCGSFDAIFPDLAGKYGDTLYPFFLDGLTTRSDLWQADGLHPNAAGVDLIVERIIPVSGDAPGAGGKALVTVPPDCRYNLVIAIR